MNHWKLSGIVDPKKSNVWAAEEINSWKNFQARGFQEVQNNIRLKALFASELEKVEK